MPEKNDHVVATEVSVDRQGQDGAASSVRSRGRRSVERHSPPNPKNDIHGWSFHILGTSNGIFEDHNRKFPELRDMLKRPGGREKAKGARSKPCWMGWAKTEDFVL